MGLGNYLGLVVAVVLFLTGFLLAFGALTVVWRRHWLSFGPSESLLGRLAAAGLLAMFAMAGGQYLIYMIQNALQPGQGAFVSPPDPAVGRNQALGVAVVAVALTVVGVLRIELYHRRVTGISRRDDTEEEWQSEEPEEPRPRARVPRERDSV